MLGGAAEIAIFERNAPCNELVPNLGPAQHAHLRAGAGITAVDAVRVRLLGAGGGGGLWEALRGPAPGDPPPREDTPPPAPRAPSVARLRAHEERRPQPSRPAPRPSPAL